MLLRPAQDERRTYPTPLATLPDLTLVLKKPNGTMFNNSSDSSTVSWLQYEPNNRLFIKIVVDQFFDRNEYWVGDYVRLSGLKLSLAPPPASSSSGTGTQVQTTGSLSALEMYVNRAEGFEIVQLGPSNDQGFFNSFYVLAPGVLDQTRGTVIVDAVLLSVVQALGSAPGDPSATVTVSSPASLLNASLQAVVTMRVGCLVGEAPSPMGMGSGPLVVSSDVPNHLQHHLHRQAALPGA